MIRLADISLDAAASQKLQEWQDEVDALPDYAARVEAADRRFGSRNRPDNATFKEVRATLDRMCSGARRCAYCEDSAGDEVEHVRPKNLYPDAVFKWENYLYACGSCNGPKRNKYAVYSSASGAEVEVTRRSGDPVVEPEPGDPLLIDPRSEDPTQYLVLDLLGTHLFRPRPGLPARWKRRAEYTIEVLGLNSRDYLPRARQQAYAAYVGLLGKYVERKRQVEAGSGGWTQADLDQIARELRDLPHPTVWTEIKRWRSCLYEVEQLFQAAPEALNW